MVAKHTIQIIEIDE